MNRIILTGNLTRDPELTETMNGAKVCRLSLAVNRPYADKDGERKTDYFNAVCFNKTAENAARYCLKGNKVLIEGSVQFRAYTDKQGIERTATDIITEKLEFLSPRPTTGTNGAPSAPTAARAQLQLDMDGDDIPF